MKNITIQCAGLDRVGLHQALKGALAFPEWYGSNLDALYDCLTEVFEATYLILIDMPDIPGFRETLEYAAAENENLTVMFQP